MITVNADPNACDMTFDYHLFGSDIDTLRLEISTDCGINWNNLFTLGGNQGNGWVRHYQELDAYQGQDALFRFIAQK